MKRIGMIISLILLISLGCHTHANSASEEILSAIVKIRSVVPQGAESAGLLGTEREGNGVVIDSEGTILTVSYLVRDAETIEVIGPDDKSVNAKLAGFDPNTGFSILRTDESLNAVPIKLGQSATVKAGNPILIAGFGGMEAAQGGRVISRQEFTGYWEYLLEEAIITAPAYGNFSGAALINADGELVGIGSLYTQVLVKGLGSLQCNVFIPIDLLNPILADLKASGRSLKAQRPWLGINAEEAHKRVFITKVTVGGPAEKAGVKPGDMILMVAGQELAGLADFYRKVWGVGSAGVQVPLTVFTGSKIQEMKVRSGDRYQNVKPQPRKDVII